MLSQNEEEKWVGWGMTEVLSPDPLSAEIGTTTKKTRTEFVSTGTIDNRPMQAIHRIQI